jgi:hypothetical protein
MKLLKSGVIRLEPGNAIGCHDLNNRGHDWQIEITVWPRHSRFRLTTGRECKTLLIPSKVDLTAEQKKMCAILGLDELGLSTFLRNWERPVRTTITLTQVQSELSKLNVSELNRTREMNRKQRAKTKS